MGDDSIQIEYNQDLQALESLLSEVNRPGDFFVSGMREVPMPKVTVDGVGVLSFPVPPAQIPSCFFAAMNVSKSFPSEADVLACSK